MDNVFSYSGTKSLEILQEARNYNKFLEDKLIEFVKPEMQALDFGAGIGEFANRVRSHGVDVFCVELDMELQDRLQKNKFITYSSLSEAQSISRIYSLNVLEHIEDDVSVLCDIHDKLNDGGKLFLYVPAFMCLYTGFDKYIGHYRRYSRSELVNKLKIAGFEIEHSGYVDSIGFICWFFMGKMPNNKTVISPLMVKIFDRILFPVSCRLDFMFSKLFGKNLLVIAKK